MKIQKFTDLRIWQDSYQLALDIYKVTNSFPPKEKFGLIDQLRRPAASIGANTAEGFGRFTHPDKIRFLFLARGSLFEVQHFLLLAKGLGYIHSDIAITMLTQCEQLSKSINAFIHSLKTNI